MQRKKVSFEDAVDDQIRQIHENEQETGGIDSSLSSKDEFQILSGRKIKYTTIDGGLTVLIRPLKAREFDVFLELSVLVRKGFTREVLTKVFECYCKILQNIKGAPISKDLLWDNLEIPDIVTITNLTSYSIANADKLFKKKVITRQEAKQN